MSADNKQKKNTNNSDEGYAGVYTLPDTFVDGRQQPMATANGRGRRLNMFSRQNIQAGQINPNVKRVNDMMPMQAPKDEGMSHPSSDVNIPISEQQRQMRGGVAPDGMPGQLQTQGGAQQASSFVSVPVSEQQRQMRGGVSPDGMPTQVMKGGGSPQASSFVNIPTSEPTREKRVAGSPDVASTRATQMGGSPQVSSDVSYPARYKQIRGGVNPDGMPIQAQGQGIPLHNDPYSAMTMPATHNIGREQIQERDFISSGAGLQGQKISFENGNVPRVWADDRATYAYRDGASNPQNAADDIPNRNEYGMSKSAGYNEYQTPVDAGPNPYENRIQPQQQGNYVGNVQGNFAQDKANNYPQGAITVNGGNAVGGDVVVNGRRMENPYANRMQQPQQSYSDNGTVQGNFAQDKANNYPQGAITINGGNAAGGDVIVNGRRMVAQDKANPLYDYNNDPLARGWNPNVQNNGTKNIDGGNAVGGDVNVNGRRNRVNNIGQFQMNLPTHLERPKTLFDDFAGMQDKKSKEYVPDKENKGRGVANWLKRNFKKPQTEEERRRNIQLISAVGDLGRHIANFVGVADHKATPQNIINHTDINKANWEKEDAKKAAKETAAKEYALKQAEAKRKADKDALDAYYKDAEFGLKKNADARADANLAINKGRYGMEAEKHDWAMKEKPYDLATKAAGLVEKNAKAQKAQVEAKYAEDMEKALLQQRRQATATSRAQMNHTNALTEKTKQEIEVGGVKGYKISGRGLGSFIMPKNLTEVQKKTIVERARHARFVTDAIWEGYQTKDVDRKITADDIIGKLIEYCPQSRAAEAKNILLTGGFKEIKQSLNYD